MCERLKKKKKGLKSKDISEKETGPSWAPYTLFVILPQLNIFVKKKLALIFFLAFASSLLCISASLSWVLLVCCYIFSFIIYKFFEVKPKRFLRRGTSKELFPVFLCLGAKTIFVIVVLRILLHAQVSGSVFLENDEIENIGLRNN